MSVYTVGQEVDYRPVVDIPCDPIPAVVVAVASHPSAVVQGGVRVEYVIDCGPTGYAAPYDRDTRIVRPYQLTPR